MSDWQVTIAVAVLAAGLTYIGSMLTRIADKLDRVIALLGHDSER